MVADALLLALLGIGVILLLIPVSIRLLKSVLPEESESEPAPEYQTVQSRNRDGGNATH